MECEAWIFKWHDVLEQSTVRTDAHENIVLRKNNFQKRLLIEVVALTRFSNPSSKQLKLMLMVTNLANTK